MGKRRNAAMDKIAAFEEELSAYAREHGMSKGCKLNARARRGILQGALIQNRTIDSVLDELRPAIKDLIDDSAPGKPISELEDSNLAAYLRALNQLH